MSPERDSGKFGADSTKSATKDYLGFLAISGVFLVRVVVVFVATEETATQQREKDDEEECHQRSCGDNSHSLIRM